MTEDSERRQDIRVPKNFRVTISEFKFPLSAQKTIEVQSADISAGGLKVESPAKFDPGVMVQVKVYIPSLNKFHPSFFKVFESDVGQYFQATAEVVWTNEKIPLTLYSLGLRFVDYYEDDWVALTNLIKKSV